MNRVSARTLGTAFALTLLGALAQTAHADDEGVMNPYLINTIGNPYGFVEYLPVGYAANPHKRWPTLFFLPGLGEVGDSTNTATLLSKMEVNGPCKLIAAGSTIFSDAGIAVFCIQSSDQVLGSQEDIFNDMARWLYQNYRIDPDRMYFTGLSAGGGGIWRWGLDENGGPRIAAQINASGNEDAYATNGFDHGANFIVTSWGDPTNSRTRPIGWTNQIGGHVFGTGLPDLLATYPNVNGDTTMPAATDMTVKLGPSGWTWYQGRNTDNDSSVRLTIYTDSDHDSWTRTYADDTVWSWMFAQSRVSIPGTVGGSIIIDDYDPGVTFTGTWTEVETGAVFWGWGMQTNATGAGSVTYTTSGIANGQYNVSLSWAPGSDRSSAVNVVVTDSNGAHSQTVDMTQGGGFSPLGMFSLNGTITVRVDVSSTGTVVADAVQLSLVGSSTDAGIVTTPVDAGIGAGIDARMLFSDDLPPNNDAGILDPIDDANPLAPLDASSGNPLGGDAGTRHGLSTSGCQTGGESPIGAALIVVIFFAYRRRKSATAS